MKKIIGIFFFSLYTLFINNCFAQQQAWNWDFGVHAALNFSSGSPVSVAGSAIDQPEGSATISDASGNLLFYTDGDSVWNRNNVHMPNGYGLNGNYSTTQSALIVQKPGSNNIYYIFTADAYGGPNGICYSIVDMTLDAGLGDVTVKNFQLITPASEKLTAIRHCNGVDFWIICHGRTDSTFYSYQLTNVGVSAPVLSYIGIPYTNFSNFYGEDIGYLKSSPNGKKLAAAISYEIDTAQVFDFDNSTGIITNPITIPFAPVTAIYGVSFSPNNQILYITSSASGVDTIFQFDLSSNNQTAIIASKYIVTTSNDFFDAIQLGPDNKIYACQDGINPGVINFPNILGVGCNYVTNIVDLSPGYCYYGLPNMIDAFSYTTNTTYLTTDTTACAASLTLSSTLIDTSYLWSTGSTTQTIDVNASGTYWVESFGSSSCAQLLNHVDTFNVTLATTPVINLGNDTTICSGSNLILNADNAGNHFLWSTGSTTQTITVSNNGTYAVTITNESDGCTGTSSRIISISQNPTPVITGDSSLCTGDSSLLDVNSFTQYNWSNGASTETISVNTTDTYIVTVTNSFGCTGTASKSVTVNPYSQASFTATDTIGCSPLNVSFINNSTNATSYLWSFGNNVTSNDTNPSYYYDSSGVYSITLIAYGAGGCNDTITRSNYISIDTLRTPISSFTAIPLSGCTPFSVTFTNNSINGTSYLWDFGDTITDTITNPSHIYTTPGIDTVKLITFYTSACGTRSDTSETTVTVNITPTASFTANDTIGCSPLTVNFNNNSSNASSYLWNFGNTATSADTNPTYVYDSSGIYTITLIAYGQGGCTDTIVKHNFITILGLPVISGSFFADSQRGCTPFTVHFTNTSTNGVSYLWNFGDGNTDTTENPLHTYLDSGKYSVSLIITSTNSCGTITDTVIYTDYISVNQFNPVAAFTSNYTIPIYTGDSIHFQNQSYDLYAPITLWQWWFGDGTGTNFINPIHQWNVPGMYQITLIVTDNKGCKDSTVYDYVDVIKGIIEIPNTFTPNNDGYNDFFEIKASGIESFQLEIFNRWGILIFESNSLNLSWDGYNQAGMQCADGTYYYVMKAMAYSGKYYNRSGFIMLLR